MRREASISVCRWEEGCHILSVAAEISVSGWHSINLLVKMLLYLFVELSPQLIVMMFRHVG